MLGNALHGILEDIRHSRHSETSHRGGGGAGDTGYRGSALARLSAEMSPDRLANGQPLLQVGMAVRAAGGFSCAGEARSVREGMRIVPLYLEEELRAELRHPDLPQGVHPHDQRPLGPRG